MIDFGEGATDLLGDHGLTLGFIPLVFKCKYFPKPEMRQSKGAVNLVSMMKEIGDVVRARLKRSGKLKLKAEAYDGVALTTEQVKALIQAATVPIKSDDEKMDLKATRSQMILPAISLALHAALRKGEIEQLTWGQINFLKGILTVGRSKTAAGTGRTIPIKTELRTVLETYLTWYKGAVAPPSPERFVFPFGCNHKSDPDRPISNLKTSWENVRAKAKVKARFHDLRHTAITNLFESGAPEATVMAIAGHVSRRTAEHYAHIRTDAKRKAVEATPAFAIEATGAGDKGKHEAAG